MLRVHTANPVLDILYAPALGPDRDSWVFLIKRVSLLLLSSVSNYPRCVAKLQLTRSRVTHTQQFNCRRSTPTDPPVVCNPFGWCSGSRGLKSGIRACHDKLLTLATIVREVRARDHSDRKSRGQVSLQLRLTFMFAAR